MLRAPLLHVVLQLRTLLRREHVHHLVAQLAASLRIRRAAFGVRGLELRVKLVDFLLLLRRQVQLPQFFLEEMSAAAHAFAAFFLRRFSGEFRALIGREHRIDLIAELLHSLRIGTLALLTRLAEILHNLLDLRFLLIAEIQIGEALHETAAMAFVLYGLRVGLGCRLLRERCRGNCDCAGECKTRDGTTN